MSELGEERCLQIENTALYTNGSASERALLRHRPSTI